MINRNLILFNSASSIDLIGGSQRSIDFLIMNAKEAYKIYFFCWNFKNNKIEIIKLINHTIIKIPHPKKSILSFIRSFLKVGKIYKKLLIKNSLIWVHSPLPYIFFRWIKKKNMTYLYSVHGPLITEINYERRNKINQSFLNLIYKIVLKDKKKIIFNSNYTLSTSINESKFLHSKNLIVNELLVDEKKFLYNFSILKKNFKKKKYDNGNFFIIPRRLVKRTGVKVFLNEIIKKKINYTFKFYITGEGTEENEIKLLCLNRKNLFFLGKIDQDLLTYLISISKGVIIPTVEAEGFCIVAKEAKLLNKFVYHTNQGGLKESLAGYEYQRIFNLNQISLDTFHSKKLNFKSNNIFIEKDESFNKKLTQYIS